MTRVAAWSRLKAWAMNVAKRRGAKGALTDHYRRTLDDPIPALGNVSPRKAAMRGQRAVELGWALHADLATVG